MATNDSHKSTGKSKPSKTPIKSTSSPNKPAGSDKTATGATFTDRKTSYGDKYDFPNMYIEQNGKNLNKKGQKLRFKLSCDGYNFAAHIDPNHLVDQQEKRIVTIDVLTGIILQDFGYAPEIIQLRGTTGARYYQKILEMDSVFKNQSVGGAPTICTLEIESRTYSGVWKSFQFERRALENTYNYDITFIVMNVGQIVNTHTTVSPVIQARQTDVVNNNANGKNQVKKVSYEGKTPIDYVREHSGEIPGNKKGIALAYLRKNWSSSPNNKQRNYPGDDKPLNKGEELVTPSSWKSVLSSNNGSSSNNGNNRA